MKVEQKALPALYAKLQTSEAGLTNEEADRLHADDRGQWSH